MKMKSDLLRKWIIFYGVILTPVLAVTKVTVKNRMQSLREKRDAETIVNDHHFEKFLIPKPLKHQDVIRVHGNLTNDSKWITVSLVMHNNWTGSADEENVACQIKVSFTLRPDHEDSVSLHGVVEGDPLKHEPSGITVEQAPLLGGLNFSIGFSIQEESIIDVDLNHVTLEGSCNLHELHSMQNIKYLTLGGQMNKDVDLMFILA